MLRFLMKAIGWLVLIAIALFMGLSVLVLALGMASAAISIFFTYVVPAAIGVFVICCVCKVLFD